MSNNTKILMKDLEKKIVDLIQSLEQFQGDKSIYPSLYTRLTSLEVADFKGKTKEIIQDLIDALNNDQKGTAAERIRKLELLSGTVNQQDAKIEGTFKEVFAYDADGDIVKQTATGEQAFTVDFGYSLVNGEKSLTSSTMKFKDSQSRNITVAKTYSYDANFNITNIDTTTTITTDEQVI